jgi:hypothetical protein
MHPSDRPAGGGEPSSQAFRASRMLVEMPCFVLSSDIVEERHLGMFAIVSDLAQSKMDFQASPRGGAQKAYYRLLPDFFGNNHEVIPINFSKFLCS